MSVQITTKTITRKLLINVWWWFINPLYYSFQLQIRIATFFAIFAKNSFSLLMHHSYFKGKLRERYHVTNFHCHGQHCAPGPHQFTVSSSPLHVRCESSGWTLYPPCRGSLLQAAGCHTGLCCVNVVTGDHLHCTAGTLTLPDRIWDLGKREEEEYSAISLYQPNQTFEWISGSSNCAIKISKCTHSPLVWRGLRCPLCKCSWVRGESPSHRPSQAPPWRRGSLCRPGRWSRGPPWPLAWWSSPLTAPLTALSVNWEPVAAHYHKGF